MSGEQDTKVQCYENNGDDSAADEECPRSHNTEKVLAVTEHPNPKHKTMNKRKQSQRATFQTNDKHHGPNERKESSPETTKSRKKKQRQDVDCYDSSPTDGVSILRAGRNKVDENKTSRFPMVLFNILTEAESSQGLASIIGWTTDGKGFRIFNRSAMENTLIPQYFGATQYKSFARNLNLYGFRSSMVDPSTKCKHFAHPLFDRSRKELCNQIRRRVKSRSKWMSILSDPTSYDDGGVSPPTTHRNPYVLTLGGNDFGEEGGAIFLPETDHVASSFQLASQTGPRYHEGLVSNPFEDFIVQEDAISPLSFTTDDIMDEIIATFT